MGGEERVERQHACGRLTVRERIERLLRRGHVPRDRRARRARRATATTASWTDFLPANMVVGQGRDRRPARGRPGRRLHGPRRRRRRGDLAEDGLAPSGSPHELRHPARPARRRHGRRRQRQVARDDGLHLRAVAARAGTWRREPVAVPGRRRRARPVRRARRRARGRSPLLASSSADTAQLFVAGPPVVAAAMGESPDKEELGRRAHADARRRGRQRGGRRGRRARPAQALPLLPARRTSGRRRRSTRRDDPADRREEELLSIVPRDPRQPYKMRAHPRGGVRPRLGVRARRRATAAR